MRPAGGELLSKELVDCSMLKGDKESCESPRCSKKAGTPATALSTPLLPLGVEAFLQAQGLPGLPIVGLNFHLWYVQSHLRINVGSGVLAMRCGACGDFITQYW